MPNSTSLIVTYGITGIVFLLECFACLQFCVHFCQGTQNLLATCTSIYTRNRVPFTIHVNFEMRHILIFFSSLKLSLYNLLIKLNKSGVTNVIADPSAHHKPVCFSVRVNSNRESLFNSVNFLITYFWFKFSDWTSSECRHVLKIFALNNTHLHTVFTPMQKLYKRT